MAEKVHCGPQFKILRRRAGLRARRGLAPTVGRGERVDFAQEARPGPRSRAKNVTMSTGSSHRCAGRTSSERRMSACGSASPAGRRRGQTGDGNSSEGTRSPERARARSGGARPTRLRESGTAVIRREPTVGQRKVSELSQFECEAARPMRISGHAKVICSENPFPVFRRSWDRAVASRPGPKQWPEQNSDRSRRRPVACQSPPGSLGAARLTAEWRKRGEMAHHFPRRREVRRR